MPRDDRFIHSFIHIQTFNQHNNQKCINKRFSFVPLNSRWRYEYCLAVANICFMPLNEIARQMRCFPPLCRHQTIPFNTSVCIRIFSATDKIIYNTFEICIHEQCSGSGSTLIQHAGSTATIHISHTQTNKPFDSVKVKRANALKAMEVNKCGKQSKPCANKTRKHLSRMFDYVLALSRLSAGLSLLD